MNSTDRHSRDQLPLPPRCQQGKPPQQHRAMGHNCWYTCISQRPPFFPEGDGKTWRRRFPSAREDRNYCKLALGFLSQFCKCTSSLLLVLGKTSWWFQLLTTAYKAKILSPRYFSRELSTHPTTICQYDFPRETKDRKMILYQVRVFPLLFYCLDGEANLRKFWTVQMKNILLIWTLWDGLKQWKNPLLQNLQTVKTPCRVILTSSNHKLCKVHCPLIFLDDSFLYLIVTKCKHQFFQTLSCLVMSKKEKKVRKLEK